MGPAIGGWDRLAGGTARLRLTVGPAFGGWDRLAGGTARLRLAVGPVAAGAHPTSCNICSVFTAILCPVDFSPHSKRALSYAMGMSELNNAHLTIVTVVDALLDAASHATGSGEALALQTQQELQALLARLSDEKGALRERPAIAVVVGQPADEILKQAVECGADLIVMGTQGLSAARRFVFGSTTDKVLRESHVPVLAVPAPLE